MTPVLNTHTPVDTAHKHRAHTEAAGSRRAGRPGSALSPLPPARTWMTLPYLTTSPCTFLFSVSFCFCSIWAACCTDTRRTGGRAQDLEGRDPPHPQALPLHPE